VPHADAVGLTASQRLEDDWHSLWGNGRATVVNGKRHPVALLPTHQRDRCSFPVLDGVANEIRHHLRKAVGILIADQVPTRIQPHDDVSAGGPSLAHHLFADLLKVCASTCEGNLAAEPGLG